MFWSRWSVTQCHSVIWMLPTTPQHPFHILSLCFWSPSVGLSDMEISGARKSKCNKNLNKIPLNSSLDSCGIYALCVFMCTWTGLIVMLIIPFALCTLVRAKAWSSGFVCIHCNNLLFAGRLSRFPSCHLCQSKLHWYCTWLHLSVSW